MRATFFLVFLSVTLVFSGAQELRILTEEDPPYNYAGPEGKPTGFAVELVQEIQKRVGNTDPIYLYAWARGYDTILNNPNVVLFTMARTMERENLFQWVGPIVENSWILILRKNSGLQIRSLEDAKKLRSIGVAKDMAWDHYLTEQGFTNLQRTVRNSQNVLKLDEGRIQAYVSNDNSWRDQLTMEGLNPDNYEPVFTIKTVQLYLAHSKTTDPRVVKSWQDALDTMKKDGSFLRILRKYMPLRQPPGPAEAPTF